MIATLTPNPSLDLLLHAPRLQWDDANRLEPPRRRPGGQGINVVRAARALGCDAVAVAPLGGPTGAELEAMLREEATPLRAVPVAGDTRVFVGVRETDTGRSLLLNPWGPTFTAEEGEALLAAVETVLERERPRWLACCGSLPPGLPLDFYARVHDRAREHGTAFVPDCDGEPLRLACEGGCDLLVPNEHEAARLVREPVDGIESAARAATALRRLAPVVAITLGAAGAVCATAAGVWHAEGPHAAEGSAVGAGDAFLAGFLCARDDGADAPGALRAGVAAGGAVLLGRGAALLRGEDAAALLAEVRLERLQ